MKKYYKNLFTAFAAVAVAVSASANVADDNGDVRILKKGDKEIKISSADMMRREGVRINDITENQLRAMAAKKVQARAEGDDEGPFEPNVVPDFDNTKYKMDAMFFYHRTDQKDPYRGSGFAFGSMLMWMMPAVEEGGTYDLIFTFKRLEDGKHIYVTVEDVKMERGMPEVKIDPTTATIEYKYRTVDPEGKPFELTTLEGTWTIDEEYPEDPGWWSFKRNPEKLGKVRESVMDGGPVHYLYGGVTMTIASLYNYQYPAGAVVDGETYPDGLFVSGEGDHDILVTPSTHYTYPQAHSYYCEDGIYTIGLCPIPGKGSQTVTNDPADYIKVRETFVASPAAATTGEKARYSHNTAIFLGDEEMETLFDSHYCEKLGVEKQPDLYYLCNRKPTDAVYDNFQVGIKPCGIEYLKSTMAGWWGTESCFMLTDHAAKGVTRPAPLNRIDELDGFNWKNYAEPLDPYFHHPVFTYAHPADGQTLGNNFRYFILQSRNGDVDEEDPNVVEVGSMAHGFSGPYGEMYSSDKEMANTIVHYTDGDAIDKDIAEFKGDRYYYGWSKDWNAQSPDKGDYTVNVVNENMVIDDIKGSVKATVKFSTRGDDHSAPTLTHLRAVNKDGVIADRFTTADEATVQLSVADFKYEKTYHSESEFDYSDYYAPQHAKVDLKFEVSPYQADDFEAIELKEDENMFYPQAYGAYYEGSLAGITKKSANGWYDLRITVADAAGNSISQVISPALNIAGLAAGIDNVADTVADAAELDWSAPVYNVMGQKVNRDFKGVAIQNGNKFVVK